MINDRAKSQIPGLGYTVTYAVGNTLLTDLGNGAGHAADLAAKIPVSMCRKAVLIDSPYDDPSTNLEKQEQAMADIMTLKKFEALGPFEIKNELINLAKATSKTTQSAFLNAGRGNPNWVATTPREGFFLLGQFAITESKRVMEQSPGIGGMPQAKGIAARLDAWLAKHMDMPGADFLSAMVKFAIKTFGFDPDAFVHELVDSIIGDNYPVPDRMLVHNERIVHEYLMWAMCGKPHPSGKFDLYAVEGGTAAMCYIFKSLKANRLLFPGDTIALGTPIFTPYLEMTHLEDYDLKVVTNQSAARESLPVHGRGNQEAGRPEDQGVLHRQSRQSQRHGDEQGDDRQDREAR